MTRVLVLLSDAGDRRKVTSALRQAGYDVERVRHLARVAAAVRRYRPDVLLVDAAGDPVDQVVDQLHSLTAAPVLVLASSDEAPSDEGWDAVAALDAGADDYLARPYQLEELLARLRAALRRTQPAPEEDSPVSTADFTVHLQDRRWFRSDGSEVSLTPTEWRLVELLVRRAGHLVTQEELLRGVWGPQAVNKSQYVRVQIAAIRRKVEPDPAHPRYFVTAPGLGLRFVERPAAAFQPS
jgi:two-component system KDP operon response regulator KdpE